MPENIKYFVFDIETVADGTLVQQIKYPEESTLSQDEAVNRYRKDLLKESDGKSDFIPWPFQVPVSIAIAKVQNDFSLLEVVSLDRPDLRPQVMTRSFWQGWLKYKMPTFVTFNGRGFDLPVLELSAFRYGIELGPWFNNNGPSYLQPRNRYNNKSHIDLLDILSNYGAARLHGGLDLCSTLLGKPGKLKTRGHMVQDIWNQGGKERIDDYCLCDVLDTYFVFLRTRVLTGEVTIEKEHQLVLLDYYEYLKDPAGWFVKKEHPSLDGG